MTDDPLSVSETIDCIAHERRRRLLSVLHDRGTAVFLPDLAEAVAGWEHDDAGDPVPPGKVKRVYMSLYHRHVPLLAEYDVVSYDQEPDTLRATDRADQVLEIMERIDDGTRNDDR